MRIYCNGKSWEIKISNIHFDGIGYNFMIEEMKIGSVYVYKENATVKFSDRLGPILCIENSLNIPIINWSWISFKIKITPRHCS